MLEKRTLVTGAGGFLGRHVVPALVSAGHQVRAMIRPGADQPPWCKGEHIETCQADLLAPDTLMPALTGVEKIVHLAGYLNIPLETPREKKMLWRVNRDGTANLLALCPPAGVKEFLLLSSVAAMGDPPPGIIADEDTPTQPGRVYGESKLAAEHLVTAARREFGLQTVILRPVVVYGEGDKGNVVKMMAQVHKGRFLLLQGGRAKKSLVYAGNLAAAVSHLLPINPKWDGATYISMDNPAPPIAELARTMATALKVKPPRLSFPAFPFLAGGALLEMLARPFGCRPLLSAHTVKKLTNDLLYTGERMGMETGFSAPFSLNEAIQRTAIWLLEKQQGN